MIDIKKIIQSTYLALGSVAIYISFTHLQSYVWIITQFSLKNSEIQIKLPLFFIISLTAGILLIICYYGFLHSKKYQLSGIAGCISFIVYFAYSSDLTLYVIDLKHPYVYIANASTMVASIILLVLSLVYWRKFEEKKDN